MPYYNNISEERLSEAHEDLQKVFNYVIKHFDNSILFSYRGEKQQNEFYERGDSQLKYPFSKHNKKPSLAVDAAPYPYDDKDIARIRFFNGYVIAIADMLFDRGEISHQIRCGADWDKDYELKDNNFNDLYHYEVIV